MLEMDKTEIQENSCKNVRPFIILASFYNIFSESYTTIVIMAMAESCYPMSSHVQNRFRRAVDYSEYIWNPERTSW